MIDEITKLIDEITKLIDNLIFKAKAAKVMKITTLMEIQIHIKNEYKT